VLVHCNAGCTRSASVVINFLMKHCDWDYDTAHKYLFDIRSCIDTDIFETQLRTNVIN
jgi:protein-tyrosine phosphatase